MLSDALVFVANLNFGIVVDHPAFGDLLQIGQGDILLHILDQDQAIAFAVFGDIGHARVNRILRVAEMLLLALTNISPLIR